jgi:UDP-N-acetyl-D-galactosamine dehydrogenase
MLGMTFKENCPDVETKIINVIDALTDYGIVDTLTTPVANPKSVLKEYGMTTVVDVPKHKFDAVVLGVSHDVF